MPFQRFRDPETNRNFLYNPVTGETKWETPLESGAEVSSSKMSAISPLPQQKDVAPSSMYDSDDDDGREETEIVQDEADDADDASSSNGDESRLLTPSKSKYGLSQNPRGGGASPTFADTVVLKAFPCMILLHAFCCEAPFAVLEGLLKSCLYLSLGVALAVVSGLTYGTSFSASAFDKARLYLREGLLFLFSALTLMIPCSAALTVYSQAATSSDFSVRPIPTFIGPVDPRRYYVFESGDADLAENPYAPGSRSMDGWGGTILHPPGRTWDVAMSAAFGTAVPERLREIEMVEEVRDRAVEAIGKEKELQEAGWLPVR
mmetsp:Transcript_28756/g.57490  ORF Transcript_28756/g.57490 Transcript_28756/m.57490 type:complete len:319 (+) Transcript_28756:235-1191(+)